MPIRIDGELGVDPFRDPDAFEELMDQELQQVLDASAEEPVDEERGLRALMRRLPWRRHY